ncbi:MAG: 3'-5' exonuclease [Acidobacteriota bacterium]
MELIEKNRLSKDFINSLSIIKFNGEVKLINREDEAEQIVKKLKKEQLLGFDTESKPSFRPGVSHPISLIQIATLDTAYLFQVNGNGIYPHIKPLLVSKKVKKIGIGLAHDITKLKGFNGTTLEGLIDLGTIAKGKGIIQTGARGLTARYLNKRLVKTSQTTNWAKEILSEKQKTYAATDAWICLMIYPLLINDNIDYHKLEDELQEKSKPD